MERCLESKTNLAIHASTIYKLPPTPAPTFLKGHGRQITLRTTKDATSTVLSDTMPLPLSHQAIILPIPPLP